MKKKTIAKIVTILIPVTAFLLILFKDIILSFVPYFPSCYIYSLTHLYCPACGNTRSVTALLHGDLTSSLRYNLTPMLLILLLSLGYIELASYSFGKEIKVLPRKLSFYLILIAMLIAYWIIRNFIPYLTP